MVYVLYDKERVYGVYKTLQLLKTNSYIFLYELFRRNKIEREQYFSIKKVFFTEARLDLTTIEKLLEPVGVYVDETSYESSSLLALNNILHHIDKRFNFLEETMEKDSRITVRFPGRDALDNLMMTKEIRDSWVEIDPLNHENIIMELKKYIRTRIEKLLESFETRVQFGDVSDKYATPTSYQVWPADIGNWNLPNNTKIFGGDMALNFEFQVPGVYGIVINPKYGYKFN